MRSRNIPRTAEARQQVSLIDHRPGNAPDGRPPADQTGQETARRYKKIPLIIFLLSDLQRKCASKAGSWAADEQLSKPEIGHLVGVMDELLEPQQWLEPKGDRES